MSHHLQNRTLSDRQPVFKNLTRVAFEHKLGNNCHKSNLECVLSNCRPNSTRKRRACLRWSNKQTFQFIISSKHDTSAEWRRECCNSTPITSIRGNFVYILKVLFNHFFFFHLFQIFSTYNIDSNLFNDLLPSIASTDWSRTHSFLV